ncbi:Pentatricopeptide repeat-containing protein mitochondrial [Spatholobus suberectus]|nr:Pentatricopeptide repeat-containing protein mitochondrial [Spatholobus suberectus]
MYHAAELIRLSKHIATPESLLRFHAVTVTSGHSTNLFIASKLISLYDSHNDDPTSCSTLFHSLPSKDTFLYNSLLKSLFSRSLFPQLLSLFSHMRASNLSPDHFTLPLVVSASAHLTLLPHGASVHALASKTGLFSSSSASASFVSLYSRCGQMDLARKVFDEIPVRDVVAWTALIIGHVQNGEPEKGLRCLRYMHGVGEDAEKPNARTWEGGFLACGNLCALKEGTCLHGVVIKNGVASFIQSSVLAMYSKCGNPREAYRAFCDVIHKDLLCWTSIIGVCARFGMMGECVRLFREMQEHGIRPDGIVIGCMLSGFGNSMDVSEGKAFHGVIIRRHYVDDEKVNDSLLFMYLKFGMLSVAERLFPRCRGSGDCWNFMVFGYGRIGEDVKCVELFREMQILGIRSESIGVVSAIASCAQLGAVNLGRSIHCNVIKGFLDGNISVTNSLIEMYGKCGKLTFAWRIFDRSERDVVSWNILISSHVHFKQHEEAVNLFNKMVREDQKPNTATLVVVLSACSHLASLEKGERVHRYINESGFQLNLPLGTTLVDVYAKCGQLQKSRMVFDSMMEKDVICWNAMISGYGMNGYAESALEIFQHMEESNVMPNEITFLSLLSACAHAGLVEEGKYVFARMLSYSVNPNLKHYTCMVDLLGRSGNLQEAEDMVLSMPISPDGGVWGALLSHCKTYNQVEMGIRIAMYAIDSEPENDGYYIMMANMYSSIGRWEEAENVRRTMKERCSMGKKAGWSLL